tara:strand:- start:17131 stop:18072 length:942 start_codon:yes stop_codon:yes gene_type:complete
MKIIYYFLSFIIVFIIFTVGIVLKIYLSKNDRLLDENENFLTIICRIKDEHFLVPSFVEYYLSQGVDMIYFIDDDSSKPYNIINPKVQFVKSTLARKKMDNMADVKDLFKKIKSAWVMLIDADEFIHTKGFDTTIRGMLETEFVNSDCVLVPWIMYTFNKREKDSNEVINDYRWRWNHDIRHPHPNKDRKNGCKYNKIECKSIFKTDSFKPGNQHVPYPIKTNVRVTESLYNTNVNLSPFLVVREKDILNGLMLCNHYRFTSIDAIKKKCSRNSFNNYNFMDNCVNNCILSDYAEVYDDILAKKWKNIKSTIS